MSIIHGVYESSTNQYIQVFLSTCCQKQHLQHFKDKVYPRFTDQFQLWTAAENRPTFSAHLLKWLRVETRGIVILRGGLRMTKIPYGFWFLQYSLACFGQLQIRNWMVYKHHEASLSVFAIWPLSLFPAFTKFQTIQWFLWHWASGPLPIHHSNMGRWECEPKPPLFAANTLKTIGQRSGQIIFPFHQPGFFLK